MAQCEGGCAIKIRVKFWGTRGSLPVSFTNDQMESAVVDVLAKAGPGDVGSEEAARAFLAREGANLQRRYGGETTCVEFENAAGGRVIVDFGSGAAVFGRAALGIDGPVSERGYTFLMSHMHWDHVQGFPFFPPAFIPGNQVRIGGGHGGAALKEALLGQFKPPYFPVPAEVLGSDLSFFDVNPDETFEAEGFRITPHLLHHTGGSYGYRFEFDGVSVVFASDAEHKPENIVDDYPYVQWAKGADTLIFDAQYALADLVLHKEDWGHSSGMVAVDLAHLADVKRVLLTHHDPAASDAKLDEMAFDTREYQDMLRSGGATDIAIDAAYDGMVVEVG